jgi:arylsulfatase A-like enzyme/Flp pilus assembly protein TadD
VTTLLAGAALLQAACFGRPRNRPEPAQPRNVLLITVDTVRADHIGAYGDRRAETPAIDRLAREGVRFLQADSCVPLTLPSHATILTGLTPPHHGLRNNGGGSLSESVPTLASVLAAGGYRTGAFVGSFVLDHRFGLGRGFQTYDDEIRRDPNAPDALEAERPAAHVVDRALAWLDRRDPGPFFLWVHLYDAHAPYDPPEPFRSRFPNSPYDGEIASDDFQIGRLLARLDARGLTRRTVVAVAADHGEALGEHGELTHGFLLYEPTLHVPLVLRDPDALPARRVIATPVSLTDLAPTLAALAGHPFPPGAALDGRDLSGALRAGTDPRPEELYAETKYPAVFGWSPLYALRQGRLKFIDAPRREIYDLSADPGEARNLADPRSPRADLAARLDRFREGETSARPAAADRETLAKLGSLGYVAPSAAIRVHSGRAKDPKDAVALFRSFEDAHRDLRAGRLDSARRSLERLVAADPGNSVFCANLGQVYRLQRSFSRAVELYRRAVALAPDDPDARYNLAVTLREAGRLEEAQAAVQEAIRRDPGRPEAHNALGIVFWSRGRPKEALAEFDRAAALDPRDPQTRNNRGNVLRELKRFPESEAAYRASIAIAPGYADPWNGLGAVEIATGRPREAAACFVRALEIAPEYTEARLNLGIARELSGDPDGALAEYRKFLAAAAKEPELASQREIAHRLIARLSAETPTAAARKGGH